MSETETQPSFEASQVVPPPERKVFGSHLPPPTRTIGLGDKLPPARRAQSGSSSESEDEDDSKMKVEQLPDASRASRRPPIVDCHNYSGFNIHIPAYTGYVTVSGHTVAVASHHHVRIYDLSLSASPIWNLDSKDGFVDTKLKDFKFTALEFRPTLHQEDRGNFLWLGTKDGHLIELDVRTSSVTAMRPAIHAHTVTHMFRHGQSMISIDDTGKVLVFTPSEGVELSLATLQPRVVRIAEKQEFAKLLGGQLWTSTRDPNGGGTVPGTSRGPVVRVYDIFRAGSVGRSLLPSEHLGTVTAGTMLASQPGHVYLAHEGGHISIWSVGDGAEGVLPQCVEVVKVSTSDVLSLEGVNDRLWAGSRKGLISAYDVTSKPWTVTNCWEAHDKLPVLRIAVDTWSMEKLDRLVVYSVGRDEQLRFWDGLLGIDWIEQELLKRETEFSTFRDMTVLIVSWNVDSAKPDQLTGTPENVNFLTDVLTSIDRPDVIAFGMQELIDLESRKMAAKTVLLGGKNKATDGTISQKVTTSYKKWYDRLVLAVRCAMPADSPYTVIHTENLVGLFTCVFVKNTEKIRLKHVALTTVKRGMGGRYGNKGAIISRFVVDDTSVCFINCHLAAGQHHVRQRNADAQAIVEDNTLLPEAGPMDEVVAYVNGGDGSMVLDHEIVFINGDMNYRIDQRREAVIAAVKAGDLEHLVIHDQLRKEMKFNRGFRLRTFAEGPLNFAPTYKYDRRSDEYDTSEKARTPAWCDRVLWRSLVPERVTQLHYRRWEANVSDHRPISAAFRITVKQVNHEARAHVKAQTLERWKAVERERLSAALQHYIDQKAI
ncbi:DNase I-like protein [Trametes cingulata]|nr:DNase I-like protein [Trametes cingulata]